MNREVFITCAVTGSGCTQNRSPHVPRSPQQIAASAIDAAKAGAAVVHCHVRDPETGTPRRDVHLYREVTDRIRAADVDVVLNLTAGMGGDMVFGDVERPLPLAVQGTDMGWRQRPRRACPPMPAGNLHARLRHDEFRRSRLRDDEHARHAARHGRHDDRHGRAARDRGLRHRPPVVRQAARPGRRAGARRPRPALHGGALGGAGRPQHLPGDGQRRPEGLDLVGLLARPQPDGLCRCRGAGGRQRPRRGRGQPVARQERARHQWPAGGARRHGGRGHGRARHRTRRGPPEARSHETSAASLPEEKRPCGSERRPLSAAV